MAAAAEGTGRNTSKGPPPPTQPARPRARAVTTRVTSPRHLPPPPPPFCLIGPRAEAPRPIGGRGRPAQSEACPLFSPPLPFSPPPRARAVPRYRHVQPPSSRGGGGGGGNGNGAAPPRARPDSGSGISSPSLSPRFTDSGLSAAGLEGVSAGLGGRSAAPGKGGDPGGLGQGHGPGSGAEEPAPPPVSPPPPPFPLPLFPFSPPWPTTRNWTTSG